MTSITHTIITEVYNFTYTQIFANLWKLKCAKVVEYEQILGITNCDKRSKHRSRSFNYSPHLLSTHENDPPGLNKSLLWMAWFAASIRQDLEWLTHAYTPQADMFRSFTTSALTSFTNNHRINIDGLLINRLDLVINKNFM